MTFIIMPLETCEIILPLEACDIFMPLEACDIILPLEACEIILPLEAGEIILPLEAGDGFKLNLFVVFVNVPFYLFYYIIDILNYLLVGETHNMKANLF